MSAVGPIRVAVAGAAGRMGESTCRAVEDAPDMVLSAAVDPALGNELADALGTADVVVDFTQPGEVLANARASLAAGVHVVVGTTGFDMSELEALCAGAAANVFVAPNFAIGAVLMMRFAAEAAGHMAKAEIIVLHHDRKLDAPSGTAIRTAELMAEAQRAARAPGDAADPAAGRPAPPPIHSVRLPGLVAHQEVIFGDLGQTLTIRHDTTSREAFMPGVLLAVRRVPTLERSPLVGLEHLMF